MLIDPNARPSLSHPERISLKIIAATLGVLSAGLVTVLFNAWLKAQGTDEVSVTAAWLLRSAETRLIQTVATLSDLSARGVDSCQPAHVEAMHQAVLVSAPVKQVMLIASNGDVLCAGAGSVDPRIKVLTSATTSTAGVMLDVLRLPDRGERFLRVRKIGSPGNPSIAALVPANLLIPQGALPGQRSPGLVRLTMIDGTLIAGSSETPDSAGTPSEKFVRRMGSKLYPIAVTTAMTHNGIIADYADLHRVGAVVIGMVALVILLVALIFRRRQVDSPIAEVAKAILADEFVPYYQPIVDIQTGRLLGVEVLARWRRTDGSLAEPSAFLSMMESSGLVLELTRLLMRCARDDVGEAIGRRPQMTIAFNVAPQHFDDALILNDVGTIFDGSPIKLTQIVLELTEYHQLKDLTGMRRAIAALQGLGCKVAIDEIGTGQTGLSYILKLGVDIIKIDKAFVEAIAAEGHSKATIDTLIDLAKNMRMEIIAEGVETFDQVSHLRERGITAAQGYAFAPPLSAGSFLQLLEAMEVAADAPARLRPAVRGVAAAATSVAG